MSYSALDLKVSWSFPIYPLFIDLGSGPSKTLSCSLPKYARYGLLPPLTCPDLVLITFCSHRVSNLCIGGILHTGRALLFRGCPWVDDIMHYVSNCTPGRIVFDSGTNNWSNLSQADRSQNFIGKAKQRFTRTRLQPRYYLADFGLSRQYDPPNALDRSSCTHDTLTPETRLDGFNDPFCMDIYCLGNLVRQNFVQVSVIAIWPQLFKDAEIGVVEIPRIRFPA